MEELKKRHIEAIFILCEAQSFLDGQPPGNALFSASFIQRGIRKNSRGKYE